MTFSRESYLTSRLPNESALRELFRGRDVHVVFDIGSCEGEDAVRYSRLFPSATIFAFEPLPENFRRIQETLIHHPANVRAFQLALSDTAGTTWFYVSSGVPPGTTPTDWDYGNKSSSILVPLEHRRVHPWIQFEREIEVETDTIERVCERESI